MCMMNISWYVFYVHIVAGWFSKNVHELVHDVVPQKKICSAGNISFSDDSSFLKRSVHHPFFFGQSGHRPSSVVRRTRSTWNLFVYLRMFHTHVKFYDRVRNRISNRVHNRTSNLFGQSRVWTPGLAHDLFCGSRVRTPALAAWSFLGPLPWCPVLSPVYPWHTSLAPTNGATGGTTNKIWSY